MPPAGTLGAQKSRRFLEPFGKVKALKSSRFLERAARPKISKIFGRAAFASGASFCVIYLFLGISAAVRWSAQTWDGESKFFRIGRSSLSTGIYALPRTAAQIVLRDK